MNITVTQTGEPPPPAPQPAHDFHRAALRLLAVMCHAHAIHTSHATTAHGLERKESRKTRPDMRRPPPGGRAGVVSTADSGGEESDRVSTVANDP
ncbi:hypothetical protein GCM10010220_01180 [Streptomyces parvulus]|nr:hypothetical protein GCM10010220_01180 [Streptomyces parvulus]